MAGDLWQLLIQFDGRAEIMASVRPHMRSGSDVERADRFIQSHDRLMARLDTIIEACEPTMEFLATQDNKLSKSAGMAFVSAMFGRDAQLPRVEKFIVLVRQWNLRFSANWPGLV
ncbi:vegetative cell wall protein GP1 [Colletotrichum tofieldiae]|nr:vegetative cell wall protein GP1 [Colletotrichum tofieldiae]